MLSKVLLGAAVTAGVASGCTLELNVFYDPSCRAARAGNPKEFPGSSEGQCRFAPAVQDYTVWQCQGNGVSLSYFKDDACSVADGASALAQPGVCTYDAKSGVYIKVGGDCCGMETDTDDVAHQIHSIKELKREAARRGFGVFRREKQRDHVDKKASLFERAARWAGLKTYKKASLIKDDGKSLPGSDTTTDEVDSTFDKAKNTVLKRLDRIKRRRHGHQQPKPPMTESDNDNEIGHESLKAQKFAEKMQRKLEWKHKMSELRKHGAMEKEKAEKDEAAEPLPGSDNADEIHYQSVKVKDFVTKTLNRLQNKHRRVKNQ